MLFNEVKLGDKIYHRETGQFIGDIVSHDFYDDGDEILCLVTDEFIYPCEEIVWVKYEARN